MKFILFAKKDDDWFYLITKQRIFNSKMFRGISGVYTEQTDRMKDKVVISVYVIIFSKGYKKSYPIICAGTTLNIQPLKNLCSK